jgi:hypothetical protein
MRFLRPVLFSAFCAALGFLAVGSASLDARPEDPKALKQKLKQEAKKKAEEEAKKAGEAKKEAEAKQAEQDRLAAVAKAEAEAKKLEQTRSAGRAKQDAIALAKTIDDQIDLKLQAEKIAPSTICTDEEFLRRVYLDITGVIPSADKAKAFLSSTATDKRTKLIDELLNDPHYGRKRADIWLAKLYPKDSNNRFLTAAPLYDWLEDQFNANTPWDQLVSSLLTATGSLEEHPEVMFFLANRSIDKLTDITTQHFLGVRLGCAQCHNHPFTATKQTEYWGMAAFFSKVVAEQPKNGNKGADNTKLAVREGNGPTLRKDFLPESAKKVNAKFLAGPEPKLQPKEPYRPELARWLTSNSNPFFAKAMVNRTWAELFGSGIVDPIDDLIETNKPSHPELLNELAKQFAETGFDHKYLVRAICNSKAYQRSARPSVANRTDTEFFSHMAVKMLTPEALFDSLTLILTTNKNARNDKKGSDAPKRGPSAERERFVQFYLGGADEIKPVEYEAGIPQALRLMNAKNAQINTAAKLLTAGLKADAAIEKIYLTTLSRRPTTDETKKLSEHLQKNPTDGAGDILWVVINSSEFSMIR